MPAARTTWLDDWRALVGAEQVVTDPSALDAAATATFPTSARSRAIVRPGSRDEVQACLRLANAQRVPVYPISRGRNWGLGSRVPVEDGGVLLDLGRMDRIVDVSERLAYATVQPGVTFRQLYEFLRDRESDLTVPVTGGPADASLIGNLVERGEAVGPYGERAAFACALEVVLPTGECMYTGFGRFAGAATAPLDPWGVGPHLDGLFTQSNLGIVTSATLWLVPRPARLQIFTFTIGANLAPAVEALRGPVLRGTIRSHCLTFWNGHKIAARDGAPADGGAPDDWYGCGALYAESLDQALAGQRLVEHALQGLAPDLAFFDREDEAAVRDGLFAGVPSDANVASAYRYPPTDASRPMHPDADRCGFIWVCASLPMDGADAARATRMIAEIMTASSFAPNIGMTCISGRVLRAFVAIVYDRDVAGEDARAMACHAALSHALASAGYLPNRLGIQAMDGLPPPIDDYGRVIARLKHALDPNDILAPGRYDFRETWPLASDGA